MMRKLSTVLFLACFLAAAAASAKVCFLPNVFGGDNDCLVGIGNDTNDPNDNGGGGEDPDPNNPCGQNAVSSFLTGEHAGLFAYYETAYGAGCWIVGCSGLYGSTSSPQSLNTSVFTVSSATYGGVTCYYATGCASPYKRECSDGAPLATYSLDSLTCYQCDEQADSCSDTNSCTGYTVKTAPANGSLDGEPCQMVYEQNGNCVNGDLLYKFKCNEGYEPQGTTCVAKECQGAYATEASKCASTGTCNGTWSIGLSTNGRSGDKYCYNCVCTGTQTCNPITCSAEVSVPANATCSNWCTPQDASCNPTGAERCTEWTCNTGYKKSGSGCAAKTCGDYSDYPYGSCTNKQCDSQTCSHASKATGSGQTTCYTAPSGSCTVECDENPCYGYDTYTKPAQHSHWTSSACRYKYVSGTSCVDGGDWYKGWECDSGYTKSGSSCIELTPEEPTTTTCEAISCSSYSLSSCPTGADCDDCEIRNTDCTPGATKYKVTSCKSGYEANGSGGCTALTCSDYGWQGTSCGSGYVETQHKNTALGSSSKTCYECTAITSCSHFSLNDSCNKQCDSQTCSEEYKYLRPNGSKLEYKKCYGAATGDCQVAKTCASEHPSDGTKTKPNDSYYTYSTDNTVSDAPCYYNISAKSCSEVHSGGTTTKPGNGWTYSQDTVNGSPCYYNKVAKTCGDYSDYPYDSCTNKQCSSQTCSSTSKATGDSTTTCYTAPSGSCQTCADINQWADSSSCESANTCATCSKNNQTGCFIPTGCSSSCLSGITLQNFYSYSSYTYGTSKCYTLDGCASGWQSSTCSGYSTTGWKSAHSSSTKCTQCGTCKYSNQSSCTNVYWSCSSDTLGVSPMTATCWDGVCEKSIYKYQPANIPGASYDDRDCCMTSDATYCSDFLCDSNNGYKKSNGTCVCDTSGGWSQNADGTCYCPAGRVVEDLTGKCIVQNETVCPKTVTDAYGSIMNLGIWSGNRAKCREAITAFCTLYKDNYNKCYSTYKIESKNCTADKLEDVMCEEEVEW